MVGGIYGGTITIVALVIALLLPNQAQNLLYAWFILYFGGTIAIARYIAIKHKSPK
jgi:multisubunit Na+/H+ antiporter MnhF subunit